MGFGINMNMLLMGFSINMNMLTIWDGRNDSLWPLTSVISDICGVWQVHSMDRLTLSTQIDFIIFLLGTVREAAFNFLELS